MLQRAAHIHALPYPPPPPALHAAAQIIFLPLLFLFIRLAYGGGCSGDVCFPTYFFPFLPLTIFPFFSSDVACQP